MAGGERVGVRRLVGGLGAAVAGKERGEVGESFGGGEQADLDPDVAVEGERRIAAPGRDHGAAVRAGRGPQPLKVSGIGDVVQHQQPPARPLTWFGLQPRNERLGRRHHIRRIRPPPPPPVHVVAHPTGPQPDREPALYRHPTPGPSPHQRRPPPAALCAHPRDHMYDRRLRPEHGTSHPKRRPVARTVARPPSPPQANPQAATPIRHPASKPCRPTNHPHSVTLSAAFRRFPDLRPGAPTGVVLGNGRTRLSAGRPAHGRSGPRRMR